MCAWMPRSLPCDSARATVAAPAVAVAVVVVVVWAPARPLLQPSSAEGPRLNNCWTEGLIVGFHSKAADTNDQIRSSELSPSGARMGGREGLTDQPCDHSWNAVVWHHVRD